MIFIYSPTGSQSRKTKARSYFYEMSCRHILFNISSENFDLDLIPGIKFTEPCRAGGK